MQRTGPLWEQLAESSIHLRRFAARVEVLRMDGTHLYYAAGRIAESLVNAAHAIIVNENGKVRSVRLIETAQTHAQRIGEAKATLPLNTKFTRRVRTEAGTWIEHHPRCFERGG